MSIAMEVVFDDAGEVLEAVSGPIETPLTLALSELDHHHHHPGVPPFALFDWEAGELWLKVADGVGVSRRWLLADLRVQPAHQGGALELEVHT